ncbi:MAG TPA: DnaJ C-terminal domain-containing protein [Phycisphaerae bacterium]|nr:DnaJ C-terminal domain-containing protein [Phycisphaerae bacterium]
MPQRDYYDILGVDRGASAEQIKAGYRKVARKVHPDVCKDPDAAEKFKEATAAYEVLSDPQKRKQYDRFGHAGPGVAGAGPGRQRVYTWGPGAQGPFAGGMGFEDAFSSSPFSGMSLKDILEALAGRGRRAGKRRRAAPMAQDVEYPITLDFLQAARGCTTRLQLRQDDVAGPQIDVRIPAGVREGSKIRLRGKGPGGGDLYIVTHIRAHPYFRRDGNDVYVDLPVSVGEAARGATVSVPTIDGPTNLKVPPGSSSGMKLRLRDRGIPDPKTHLRGHQYAVIKIVLPSTISEEGGKLLEEFDRTDPVDPRKKAPW